MEKIIKKCIENNLTFIGFNNEENKYKNNKTKLILKCNICGYTWDTTSYDKFISRKSACKQCTNKKHLSVLEIKERIIDRCNELNYEFIGFKDNKISTSSKIILKCRLCNKIWETTTVINFLKKNRKSHNCKRSNPSRMPSIYKDKNSLIDDIKKRLDETTLEFISIEGEYKGIKNCTIKVKCKICKKENTITYHTLKQNKIQKCKSCQFNGKINNNEAIINIKEKCKLLNYEFLGFNNEEGRYNGKDTKLILRCNKCGRIWKSSSYANFISKIIKCIGCTNSWKMEKEIKYFLDENNIKYEEQKTFDWLKYKSNLYLDFYLPEYNIFIECQGRQHFLPVDAFGGEKGFESTKIRDKIKLQKCIDNNIKPLYFSNKDWGLLNNQPIITNKEEIIKIIKNG